MPKQPLKAKRKPKKEESYILYITFNSDELTIDERDSIVRRAFFNEQNKYVGQPFRGLVVEKTMQHAKLKIFVKKKYIQKL